MSARKVLEAVEQYDKFLICTHTNPDPDALASQVAFGIFLEGMGKKVVMISETPVPRRFLFLPGMKRIKPLGKRRRVTYDAAIITDAGELDRIGEVKRLLDPQKPIINIDHHITNHYFGDVDYVLPKSSSTCEVIYGIFKKAGFQFDRQIAELLYVGAMTDTGSFRYTNTTAQTHRMAAELLEFPISANDLYKRIYEQVPANDLKYFTQVVSRFEFLCGGKIVCVNLAKEIVKKFSEQFDLRDKIFGYLRTMEGVEVLVIFTELANGRVRVNFRSQGKMDVARIAEQFQGGGHHKASGCELSGTMGMVRRKILAEMKKQVC